MNKNAIKKDALFSDKLEFLQSIPFERFHKKNFFSLNEADKDLFQAEVLVKRNIPKTLIFNI